MLIQFSVKNYKTFKDKATISFMASNYDKDTREEDNICIDEKFNQRILKSAVIYGANASGKSVFLDAITFMKEFVITSSKNTQKGDKINLESFKLNQDTENEPSEFEIIFTFKNILYRYGFEADNKRITSEWFYYKPNTKEVELFYRDHQHFEIHERSFQKGSILVKKDLIRDNALFLSVAAQFNEEKSLSVISWFGSMATIYGTRESVYKSFTKNKIKNIDSKLKILELLKAADLGIQDIKPKKFDLKKLPDHMPKEIKEFILKKAEEDDFYSDVLTSHRKYNSRGELIGYINFLLEDNESLGTRKFFALTGPVLDSLENGNTLLIDELDSKLHPNLVCKIISLFNSKLHNPKNAQLLFNTHDTNLLDSGLFRKDQIWFTEKNRYGEAKLYSLADFKSNEVRKTEAFEENYIRGKYGAVPFLNKFDNPLN